MVTALPAILVGNLGVTGILYFFLTPYSQTISRSCSFSFSFYLESGHMSPPPLLPPWSIPPWVHDLNDSSHLCFCPLCPPPIYSIHSSLGDSFKVLVIKCTSSTQNSPKSPCLTLNKSQMTYSDL